MSSTITSILLAIMITVAFSRTIAADSATAEDYYKSKRGLAVGVAGYGLAGLAAPAAHAIPPYYASGATPVAAPAAAYSPLYAEAAIKPAYLAAYAPPTSLYARPAFAPAVATPYAPAAAYPVTPTYNVAAYAPAPGAYSPVPAYAPAYAPAVAKAPVGYNIYG